MITAGPPRSISVRTTGPGASIRSPENPAPQPTASVCVFLPCRMLQVCSISVIKPMQPNSGKNSAAYTH